MNLQEGIIEEFQRHFNKYINSVKRIEYNGKFLDSYKKLNGAIAAEIIKHNIKTILESHNLPYKITENNVYIEGCFTEWDLIIVKKNAINLDGLPIYRLDDVVVVVECKAFGLFFNSKNKNYNPLEKFLSSYKMLQANNENLRPIYITLSEQFPNRQGSISYIELTKEVMYQGTGCFDNVFCFSKNKK